MTVSAIVRTVRRLDERSEEKTVAGIRIEKGVPYTDERSERRTPAVRACLALEVGESFVHTSRSCVHTKLVKATGRTFRSRVIAGGKHRIWRIA